MSRLAAAVVALGLALAGCGGSEAEDALDEATAKLGEIKSGDLGLKVAVEPTNMGDSAIGFELDGPFALAGKAGELPRAEMAYTQIAGPNRADVRFISSGEAAWVEVEGQAYELDPEQVERLQAGDGEGGGPLAELDVASWTRDAKLSEGARVDGRRTERVRGSVDVAEAINDLARVLEQTGGGEAVEGLAELEDEDADRVEEAVRSSPIEIVFGKQDRLLRRLRVTLDFAIEPRELRGELGRLSGAKVTLDLRISDPNGQVRIEEPADALPYEQLPSG